MRTDSRATAASPGRAVPRDTKPVPVDSKKMPADRSVPTIAPEVEAPASPSVAEPISLLSQEAASEFRSRWDTIQSGFVDDPRRTVQEAAELVEEAMARLAEFFAEKREHVKHEENMATEDLRQTLRHYRLLLNRLF